MSFIIYIEGGGDRNRQLETFFRRAWSKFFENSGLGKSMPSVVRGGSRNRTYALFSRAIKINTPGKDQIPILLVDSEDAVQKGYSVWEHLRTHDSWTKPTGAGEEHAFLMVQVMETWLLADRNALREFFRDQLKENVFKQWPQLESISKANVLDVLNRATAQCSKQYKKGKITFELLQRVDPALVEAACPHAKSLLDRLRK